MGTESRVQFLKKYIKYTNGTQVDYNLMIKKRDFTIPEVPDVLNLKIKKANSADSLILLDLEVEYQKEEVALNASKLNKSIIYKNLKNNLNEHVVYFLTNGVNVLAKAGTNAIGYKWNQIGGVFTDSKYRNKGLSTWLMNYLLSELEKDGKKTVLFVKDNNFAAEKVYTKLGFEKICKFIIYYYI